MQEVIYHKFKFGESGELMDRFLKIHKDFYSNDYYYYDETSSHLSLFNYYSKRPGFDLVFLIGECQGKDVARTLISTCSEYDWASFGFFECVNDPIIFQSLEKEMLDVAKSMSKTEVRGPIEINAFHGWQFLLWSETQERWFADPYHKPYYPVLFEQQDWSQSDPSVSWVMSKDLVSLILMKFSQPDEVIIKKLGEVEPEIFLPQIYDIMIGEFTSELHRFIPIEMDVFLSQYSKILGYLDDPYDLLMYYDKNNSNYLLGVTLTYTNFIDKLCNPDGSKPLPDPATRQGARWGLKMGVKRNDCKHDLFRYGLKEAFEHCTEKYGHDLYMKHTQLRVPYFKRLYPHVRITQRYCTSLLSKIDFVTVN